MKIGFSLTFHTEICGADIGFKVPIKPLSNSSNSSHTNNYDSIQLQKLWEKINSEKEIISKLQKGGEPCDDSFLTRWLVSKGHDIEEAYNCIKKHASWRSEFVPKGRISENEISRELAAKKCFLQGYDLKGNVVLIVKARNHDMNSRDLKESERFICYILDNASALSDQKNGEKKICCLFDLSGIQLKNLDAKVLATIFELLQKHYPERLGMMWFLNSPLIFWAVWRVVAPCLKSSTRERMRFMNCKSNENPFNNSDVPREIIPKEYGGDASFIHIDEGIKKFLPSNQTQTSKHAPSLLNMNNRVEQRSIVKKLIKWLWISSRRFEALTLPYLKITWTWIREHWKITYKNRYMRWLWQGPKRFYWFRNNIWCRYPSVKIPYNEIMIKNNYSNVQKNVNIHHPMINYQNYDNISKAKMTLKDNITVSDDNSEINKMTVISDLNSESKIYIIPIIEKILVFELFILAAYIIKLILSNYLFIMD